jgi:hypothetical protein
MSAGVLQSADAVMTAGHMTPSQPLSNLREASFREAGYREPGVLNSESFAWEQIRGLVRHVFFSGMARAVRQVVFSAVEAETDVGIICRQVGEALALDTAGSIAVVSRDLEIFPAGVAEGNEESGPAGGEPPLRQIATRVGSNLWLLPQDRLDPDGRVEGASPYGRLWNVRQQFEYSIVQAPAAGVSSEAAALGQSADGIILVLEAHGTRRATARKIKEALDASQTRLLGTVLSGRRFPIPEAIYRRL